MRHSKSAVFYRDLTKMRLTSFSAGDSLPPLRHGVSTAHGPGINMELHDGPAPGDRRAPCGPRPN